MFENIESRNGMLIYAVIGFGSIALVALGELSGAEAGSVLYHFYLKLVFGGFLVFYSVLFHFIGLSYFRKLETKGPRILNLMFGERASRIIVFAIAFAVLVYWIFAFAVLMKATGFEFF